MKLLISSIMLVGAAIGVCASAPTASADVNISGLNIGNHGNAHASFGNVAIALGPLDKATANGGVANVAFASGGSVASKQGPGSFNLVTAAGNSSSTLVNGSFNVSSTLNQASSSVNNANGTISVAAGKNTIKPSTTSTIGKNLRISAAFCGGSTSAQGRINLSFGDPCRGD